MTVKAVKKGGLTLGARRGVAEVALCFLSLLLLALLLKNPRLALSSTAAGLSLCVRKVIPALFPFMVLSELLFRGNAVSLIARFLCLPSRVLFGISGESGAALLFGLLCGAPVGAKSAVSLYRGGRIDRRELTRLLTLCTPPSASFLIGAVGISTFGSADIGKRLFIASLISCLLVGVVGRFIPVRVRGRGESEPEVCHKRYSLTSLVTEAVSSSAVSMLYVCGFVVFFSTLGSVLEYLAAALSLPRELYSLFFGFFEMTAGVERAAQSAGGIYLAAAISGWSGLSSALQVISICRDCNISFLPYFVSRLVSALIFPLVLLITAGG